MAVPTRQQLDFVSNAAKIAGTGEDALGEILMFGIRVENSAQAASLPTADWSTAASGTHQGFNPATWANYMAALASLQTWRDTPVNGVTPAQAFRAMAEQQ